LNYPVDEIIGLKVLQKTVNGQLMAAGGLLQWAIAGEARP
jgi:hypothetical protein